MKIFSLIFILAICLISPQIYSQSVILNRTIQWEESRFIKSSQSDSSLQSPILIQKFKNAIYPNHKTNLPYFSELIKTDSIGFCNQVDKIEIVNTIPCSDLEIINASKFDIPTDKLEYKSSAYSIRKESFLNIILNPFIKSKLTGEIRKVTSFKIFATKSVVKKGTNIRNYSSHSVLSKGHWFKIKVQQDGIFKLTYSELRDLGFQSPENIHIYGNGGGMLPGNNNEEIIDDLRELSVLNKNNALYFYAKGPHKLLYDKSKEMVVTQVNLYSNYAYYFLSDQASQVSNQISNDVIPTSVDKTIRNYIYTIAHERQDTNILHSGQQWFGEYFTANSQKKFLFKIPNFSENTISKCLLSFVARSQIQTSYTYNIENINKSISLESVDFGSLGDMFTQDYQKFEYKQTSTSPVLSLNYNANIFESSAWLDYIQINADCILVKNDSILNANYIEKNEIGSNCRFIFNNVKTGTSCWNISTFPKVSNLPLTTNESEMYFDMKTKNGLNQFVSFNESDQFLHPITKDADIGEIPNQDLHALGSTDLIIVSHPSFLEQAKQLVQLHEEVDKIKGIVVTTDQIYNEFSSGGRDISAIRNFVKMFYDRANSNAQIPRYLLLFGDGSFDNLKNTQTNNNFIPTFQSLESSNKIDSYVSDDYYGMLDDNEGNTEGMLDIGIGRLPVKNQNEANTVLQKIKTYTSASSMGEWRNNICFIGDNADYNLHSNDAEKLSTLVKSLNPNLNHDKIYIDAFNELSIIGGRRSPDANSALINSINKGALIVNYSGHGSESQLSAYKIISIPEIATWNNPTKLPVFLTATCEFSRYDESKQTTGGETLVLTDKGGAVAIFGTTRLVFQSENFRLNTAFYNFAFNGNNQQQIGLGEIMSFTKNSLGASTNKLNFTLLGDPALKLVMPRQKIQLTSVNKKSINLIDTIQALSSVELKGFISDKNNLKDTHFTGVIDIQFFDKTEKLTTLNNRSEGYQTFNSQKSLLFKGKASVTNGDFSIEFITPKDINYSFGNGKLSFYAENKESDATGSFDKIIIGGISKTSNIDLIGPEIRLFFNDSNFVYGGLTNPNTKLLAFFKDQSGINTAGRGIGHDITLVLDDNNSKKIIVNDFYSASLDSYKSGKLEYYLKDLPIGAHQLKLKAWDINNNSSEKLIEFYVSDINEFKIEHLLNYPNPFTSKTSFYFEHNQIGKQFEVELQIFTITGKLIKTIFSTVLTMGSLSDPIPWDGKDEFGDVIGKGVYIYKLKASADGFKDIYKIEKLLILR